MFVEFAKHNMLNVIGGYNIIIIGARLRPNGTLWEIILCNCLAHSKAHDFKVSFLF